MEEKNKEFALAQEHAAPPPECTALPPEVLPPDTVLPGEASAAESAAALKKKTAKWKKIAIMLVGLSAMTAVAVTGGGTAEDPVPATPDTRRSSRSRMFRRNRSRSPLPVFCTIPYTTIPSTTAACP